MVQTIFDHHVTQVAPVKELDIDVRVQFPQAPYFAVLARGQLWPDGGQLNVELFIGEVEVGRKSFRYPACFIPCQSEGAGLVLPLNAVVVENTGEFFFNRVDEFNVTCGGWIFQKAPPNARQRPATSVNEKCVAHNKKVRGLFVGYDFTRASSREELNFPCRRRAAGSEPGRRLPEHERDARRALIAGGCLSPGRG